MPISIAEISLSEREIQAANRVLESGALRQGKECAAFEAEFAEKTDAKFAVASSSGSSALHLFYLAHGFEPGDEVIVPSFTFIATASMPAFCGLKPVFCDVAADSFLIDLEYAETLITERTRAISPVHLFGNVCDIDAVGNFADKHNLAVLWDAAQAHGGRYKGRDVGSFSDGVAYSFYPSKNMFVGEGGMTCTNDEALAEKMRILRSHGATGKYLHTALGLNYRMTDVEAAIGREQLKRLDDMLARRRSNAAALIDGLKDIPGIHLQKITPETEHAWHQFCLVVEPESFGGTRDQLAGFMQEAEIATAVHYPRGLHQQPVFESLAGDRPLPATEYLAQNILAIPVHHGLGVEDTQIICDVINRAWKTGMSQAA